MATTAIQTTLSDGDGARVTQWRMPPGSSTGEHIHQFDYVVLPTTGGTVDGDGGPERRRSKPKWSRARRTSEKRV